MLQMDSSQQKSLDWGIKDNDLYNETLTGWTKSISLCSICLSELRTAMECPKANHLNMPSSSHGRHSGTPRLDDSVCVLYNHRNGNKCTSLHANMATTVRNVAAGIQSPNAQSKSDHIQHGKKDHEGGNNSVCVLLERLLIC